MLENQANDVRGCALWTALRSLRVQAPAGSAVRYDTLAQWAIQKKELENVFSVKTEAGVRKGLRVLGASSTYSP